MSKRAKKLIDYKQLRLHLGDRVRIEKRMVGGGRIGSVVGLYEAGSGFLVVDVLFTDGKVGSYQDDDVVKVAAKLKRRSRR